MRSLHVFGARWIKPHHPFAIGVLGHRARNDAGMGLVRINLASPFCVLLLTFYNGFVSILKGYYTDYGVSVVYDGINNTEDR